MTNKIDGKRRFTATVSPSPKYQTNQQTPGLLVLPTYLFLVFIFRFYVTQFNALFSFESKNKYDDSKNQNNIVMRTISIVVFIQSKYM